MGLAAVVQGDGQDQCGGDADRDGAAADCRGRRSELAMPCRVATTEKREREQPAAPRFDAVLCFRLLDVLLPAEPVEFGAYFNDQDTVRYEPVSPNAVSCVANLVLHGRPLPSWTGWR